MKLWSFNRPKKCSLKTMIKSGRQPVAGLAYSGLFVDRQSSCLIVGNTAVHFEDSVCWADVLCPSMWQMLCGSTWPVGVYRAVVPPAASWSPTTLLSTTTNYEYLQYSLACMLIYTKRGLVVCSFSNMYAFCSIEGSLVGTKSYSKHKGQPCVYYL